MKKSQQNLIYRLWTLLSLDLEDKDSRKRATDKINSIEKSRKKIDLATQEDVLDCVRGQLFQLSRPCPETDAGKYSYDGESFETWDEFFAKFSQQLQKALIDSDNKDYESEAQDTLNLCDCNDGEFSEEEMTRLVEETYNQIKFTRSERNEREPRDYDDLGD